MNHKNRYGKFSSSGIHKLIKKGRGNNYFSAPALTYIEEKQIERRLGRSLSTNAYSQPIAWGHIMERVCHERLEMYYKICSTETVEHHDKELAEFWCGTPDYKIIDEVIAEQKSYQLKNFALYTDCLLLKDVALLREKFPEEYWQIVSNCIINGLDIGEAISFMPYRSTLEDLKERLNETDLLDEWKLGDPWKYRFITERELDDLPCIDEDGYYQEITRFRFVIPDEDKLFLEERVREAIKLLK